MVWGVWVWYCVVGGRGVNVILKSVFMVCEGLGGGGGLWMCVVWCGIVFVLGLGCVVVGDVFDLFFY